MVGDRSTSLERRRWLPVHTGPTLTAGPPKAFPKRTASAARAQRMAVQTLRSFDNGKWWKSYRDKYVWPPILALIFALGAVLTDYFAKVFRFYSGRGIASLVNDDLRKELGFARKEIRSALALPENNFQPSHPRGDEEKAAPRSAK
jgi:hypothetical protein